MATIYSGNAGCQSPESFQHLTPRLIMQRTASRTGRKDRTLRSEISGSLSSGNHIRCPPHQASSKFSWSTTSSGSSPNFSRSFDDWSPRPNVPASEKRLGIGSSDASLGKSAWQLPRVDSHFHDWSFDTLCPSTDDFASYEARSSGQLERTVHCLPNTSQFFVPPHPFSQEVEMVSPKTRTAVNDQAVAHSRLQKGPPRKCSITAHLFSEYTSFFHDSSDDEDLSDAGLDSRMPLQVARRFFYGSARVSQVSERKHRQRADSNASSSFTDHSETMYQSALMVASDGSEDSSLLSGDCSSAVSSTASLASCAGASSFVPMLQSHETSCKPHRPKPQCSGSLASLSGRRPSISSFVKAKKQGAAATDIAPQHVMRSCEKPVAEPLRLVKKCHRRIDSSSRSVPREPMLANGRIAETADQKLGPHIKLLPEPPPTPNRVAVITNVSPRPVVLNYDPNRRPQNPPHRTGDTSETPSRAKQSTQLLRNKKLPRPPIDLLETKLPEAALCPADEITISGLHSLQKAAAAAAAKSSSPRPRVGKHRSNARHNSSIAPENTLETSSSCADATLSPAPSALSPVKESLPEVRSSSATSGAAQNPSEKRAGGLFGESPKQPHSAGYRQLPPIKPVPEHSPPAAPLPVSTSICLSDGPHNAIQAAASSLDASPSDVSPGAARDLINEFFNCFASDLSSSFVPPLFDGKCAGARLCIDTTDASSSSCNDGA